MAQTTRGGFLLREPNRPPAAVIDAALLGKALKWYQRPQTPRDIPGSKKTDHQSGSTSAGSVLAPKGRTQMPSEIPGAVDNSNRGVSKTATAQVLAPKGSGFVSPKIQKGYLVSLEAGVASIHPFMFNPTEITRDDAWEWAFYKIPGASHPVVGGGTGGARTISMTLYFDGDRGRSHLRDRGPGENAPVDASDPRSLDISDELRYYQSRTFPRIPTRAIGGRGPDRLVFSYGTLFKKVECLMHSCSVTVTAFTPEGAPLRATARLLLEEVVRQSVACTDVYPDPQGAGAGVSMNGTIVGDVG